MSLSNKMARAQAMGDPGFFGSLWKGIKKIGGAALGVASSILPGPIGGAVRTVGGAIFGGARQQMRPQLPARQIAPQRSMPGIGTQRGWQMQIPPFTPYPLVGYTETPGAPTAAPPAAGGLPPRGYKLNKSGYFVHAGPPGTDAYFQGVWVPPRSQFVRARRRNPLNPRALDRATSRVTSFANADSRSRRKVKKAAAKIR